VDDQVRIIDILPTILSLARMPLRTPVEGRDIGPLLRGLPLVAEPALCELQVRGRPTLRAARTNRSKFIGFPASHWWQFGYQYFDLERDPGERKVLSPWAGGFIEARGTLARLTRDAAAFGEQLGERVVATPKTDPELEERLRSLGYVGGPK
jgi:arylsulfatase A-like enzyme